MQAFSKYNSLVGFQPEKHPEYTDYLRGFLGDARCVVTEKILGANLAVRTDGEEVIFSRRCADLAEGESFYGIDYIKKEMSEAILEMHKDLREMVKYHHEAADEAEARGESANRPPFAKDFNTITIRGEFAGGNYPHPDVPKLEGSTGGAGQVGKGQIWYCQDKNFYAFDMEVDGQVLSYYDMACYCHSYSIPLAPALFFGTFEECLEFSLEHVEDDSLVPTMAPLLNSKGAIEGEPQHLPMIPNNTREGHVIRPVEPMTLPNGKSCILKHKGPKFLENKGGKSQKVSTKTPEDLPENLQGIVDGIMKGITENRLHSVMSKEELGMKDFRKAIGLTIQDALDEHVGSTWSKDLKCNSTASERKQVMKRVTNLAASELRDSFFNHN